MPPIIGGLSMHRNVQIVWEAINCCKLWKQYRFCWAFILF